jgi:UDP-N-acetyl-D-mannosaminuronate dehydrogenase
MFVRRIAVIGSGYVGLTTGACLASLGHRVVCADIDEAKVERLRRGVVDILEPGLPELVAENQAAGRLRFVVVGSWWTPATSSTRTYCAAPASAGSVWAAADAPARA